MIRVFRIFLAALFFVAFGLGSLLYPVFGFIFGRRFLRFGYCTMLWCGELTKLFHVDISPADRARLAACHGCVVVMNHITLIDIVIVSALLGDSTCVVKGAVGRNPFFASLSKAALLDATDPARTLEQATNLLNAGVNVVVFPEGTRTPLGAKRTLHRGAAQIALHAGTEILPIRLKCEPSVLAKGNPWWDVGERMPIFSLTVGTPIPALSKGGRTEAKRLTDLIAVSLFEAEPLEPSENKT